MTTLPPAPACAQRTLVFAQRCSPLPGAVPRDNPRPMTVTLAHDRNSLRHYLQASHPHVTEALWQQRVQAGRLAIDGHTLSTLDRVVRAGNRVVHTIPKDVEPNVSVQVNFLFEDDDLLVLSKPAPLPVHPCGRYNRNSLLPLLTHAFGDEGLRPVHRLDADTTGLLVLAKSATAATALGRQFEARTVKKLYLARVQGNPPKPLFECALPITNTPGAAGKRAAEQSAQSQPAHTSFECLAHFQSESLVSASPRSGRTNQIRVHLAALGLPIVGDHSYSGDEEFSSGQAQLCLHAWRLTFAHPRTGATMTFEDHCPAWAQP